MPSNARPPGVILDEFADDARDPHFRQYVGHMVRHIMDECGYELDQLDVRIRKGPVFTRAARIATRAMQLAWRARRSF